MNRPVPAPIHTKSFNFWKTKFHNFVGFLAISQNQGRLAWPAPSRIGTASSKYINYLHVIFYQRKRLLALIFKGFSWLNEFEHTRRTSIERAK